MEAVGCWNSLSSIDIELLIKTSRKINSLVSPACLTGEALRTLALAVKFDLKDSKLNDYDGQGHPSHGLLCDPSNFASVEQGMVFLGMVGIIDPPRPECMDAITACKEVGQTLRLETIFNNLQHVFEASVELIGPLQIGSSWTIPVVTKASVSKPFFA